MMFIFHASRLLPYFRISCNTSVDKQISHQHHRSCKGRLLPSKPQYTEKRSNNKKVSMQKIYINCAAQPHAYIFEFQMNTIGSFNLQVYGAIKLVMPHQSHGQVSKRGLSDVVLLSEGKMGSGDRDSSWAASMVVDRLCATCPWGMDLNRETK